MGAPEQEPRLVLPGARTLATEFPLLHPKLPVVVNLLALLQCCSAGAGNMTATVMKPLKYLHWSQIGG